MVGFSSLMLNFSNEHPSKEAYKELDMSPDFPKICNNSWTRSSLYDIAMGLRCSVVSDQF